MSSSFDRTDLALGVFVAALFLVGAAVGPLAPPAGSVQPVSLTRPDAAPPAPGSPSGVSRHDLTDH